MAITRGAVSGPTFAGAGGTVGGLSTLTLTLGVGMSGQVLVAVVGDNKTAMSSSSIIHCTDTHGNIYTGYFVSQPTLEQTPFYVVFFVTDLTLGTALTAGDTITITLTGAQRLGVGSVQATEYNGLDITSGGAGNWRTFQEGTTTTSGAVPKLGVSTANTLGFAVHLRAPRDTIPSTDPTATFSLDTGVSFSFVASGDTGPLAYPGGAASSGAYRYYSYDLVPPPPSAVNGHWSPVVANAVYAAVTIQFGALATGGVSLARSSAGHMFAAWQDRGFVSVARSLDQAFTWPLQKQIATDAAAGASPWLFIYRDDLFLIYHSAANFLVLYRLVGLLDAAPVLMLSAQPYQFPSAVLVRPGLMILAAYDLSSHLKVFSSPDFGVTLTLLKDYGVQTVERPALSMDRHGGLHLIYRTTANALMWDYCPTPSGVNWLGATLFQASGAFPGMSTGKLNGFVTWFGSAGFSELFVSSLAPDCHSLGPLALPPAFTALTGSPGTWIDEHDEWWFLARQNSHSFGDPPPGSPPGDPGGGGAIIGGGGEGGFGGGLRVIESE